MAPILQSHPLKSVFLLGAVSFVVFVAWSNVADVTEVDRFSGRLRRRRCLGPLVFHERVEETDFSRRNLPWGREPEWMRAITVSRWQRASPYYRYSSVLSDLRALSLLSEAGQIDQPEQVDEAIKNALAADRPDQLREIIGAIERGQTIQR